jgi:hypothetical protein
LRYALIGSLASMSIVGVRERVRVDREAWA